MKTLFIRVSDIDLGQAEDENVQLRKQNALLKRKIERLEVDRISDDVFMLLDKWLDSPIPEDESLKQDARAFAKSITRYVYRQLNN